MASPKNKEPQSEIKSEIDNENGQEPEVPVTDKIGIKEEKSEDGIDMNFNACKISSGKSTEEPRLEIKVKQEINESDHCQESKEMLNGKEEISEYVIDMNINEACSFCNENSTYKPKTSRRKFKKLKTEGFVWTFDDDIELLKFVFAEKKPQNLEEFLSQCSSNNDKRIQWAKMENSAKRFTTSREHRWRLHIRPLIKSHFSGLLGQKWKKEFLLYVLQSKPAKKRNIDFKEAKKLWPFLQRYELNQLLENRDNPFEPLHVTVERNLEKKYYEDVFSEHQQALVEFFKNM